MSDNIPTKDGAPDWERLLLRVPPVNAMNIDSRLIYAAKLGYIAGLERCAEWHVEQSNSENDLGFGSRAIAHAESVSTIRQWIEKEKANG